MLEALKKEQTQNTAIYHFNHPSLSGGFPNMGQAKEITIS